ncbi:hypothetical protein HYC85_006469 [Camellia sinensis]|uniref:MYB-CC type transcription factor LHEQLE-containing domain-containing protein n=1 Tax=Camellia sinensis TaxID=4442 RepID=A0A7J7HL78_CAMSI|nr:hypothetical protein HYC85_006469 [Camellia sinensis]
MLDSDMGSSRSDGVGKERLKWTQELHDLFERAVNQLGGPDSKFRNMNSGTTLLALPGNTGCQSSFQNPRLLNEALQMQKEAEKRLSDQNEVQRSLKLKIEAQSRFLERIAVDFKNRVGITKPSKPFSTISLPSLCEESESNAKEFESDSEIDKIELNSEDEFQAHKRLKRNTDIFHPRYNIASLDSGSYNQNILLPKASKAMYPSYETNIPWNVGSCQSSLMPPLYNWN